MTIGVGEALPLHGDMVVFMAVSTEDFTIPGDGTALDMAMDGTTGAGEATDGTIGAGEAMDGIIGAGEATDGADTTTLTTIPATGLAISTIGATRTMPAEEVSTTPIPGLGALP
ncbi:hypothetical protein DHC50_16170 [Arenibacter sp. A80]|nr:hypothetical protein [Arenibacter sp. A80]RFT55532.1 hypothetical protein D0S24_16165 [Arenibacter sp. P308M17]